MNGSWDYSSSAGTFTEKLTSPAGTTGTIGVPTYGSPNVSVTINGATAQAASSDANYLYFTNVAPGSYTVVASGVHTPRQFDTSVFAGQLPPGYTPCATESGTCTPNGQQVMAFGAGNYAYQVITGPTACTNATFGGHDPAVGVLKTCYLAPKDAPAGYSQCAEENGTCTFSGTEEVAFGGNGAYRFTAATGSIPCTSAEFGPIRCLAPRRPATSPRPDAARQLVQCATEHGSCAVTGSQPSRSARTAPTGRRP